MWQRVAHGAGSTGKPQRGLAEKRLLAIVVRTRLFSGELTWLNNGRIVSSLAGRYVHCQTQPYCNRLYRYNEANPSEVCRLVILRSLTFGHYAICTVNTRPARWPDSEASSERWKQCYWLRGAFLQLCMFGRPSAPGRRSCSRLAR
jgi:hypothetical protein